MCPVGDRDISGVASYPAGDDRGSSIVGHYFQTLRSPWGWATVCVSDKGIKTLCLSPQQEDLNLMRVDLQCAHSVSDQQSQMLLVIEQRLRCGDDITDLPLDVRGTPFQLLVWSYLRTIKYGHTATYAKVADAIGRPRAIRAVAQACACNKVALAIPCHRVVRSDGALGGYRWGLTLKQHILSAESHNL